MSTKINLNPNQQKAVNHKTGPLIVVAGAGTGKTRVISERVKHLLEDKDTSPNNILALTFTDKASNEMLDRIQGALPLAYEEPWVYTFHSFCDRILKREGLEIGLDPSYKITPKPEQWLLIRQNLFKMSLNYYRPLGNPTKFISAILDFISRLQDENISPEDLANFLRTADLEPEEEPKWKELLHIYETYQSLKIQKSRMDFGDQITWTIKLFKERPNILKKYQAQFTHILVDEFQDTNYAQYELIKLLFPSQKEYQRSLTVVGDDSQSIYKFRGAAISNILQFQEDYPDTQLVTLLENYRSEQTILDPAYKLISNNNPDSLESKLGISKKLVSQVKQSGRYPEIIELENLEDEVDFVVTKIIEILGKEPQYTYKDFAILARANNHLDPFVLALRKYNLPYQLVGNRGLYDRNEIRDVTALLKILVDPKDQISLYRVMNMESLEIDPLVISDHLATAKFEKRNLWDVIQDSKDTKVQNFLSIMREYQSKLAKIPPVTLVYDLVHKIGYLEQFLRDENLETQLCLKNLNIFLEKIKKFEVQFNQETKEIPTLVDFLEYLEIMMEAGDNPAQAEIEDIDTINLMTVHASKGLEFPVVFMVNLTSNRFPTRDKGNTIGIPEELIKENLPEGDPHIQEERRLFYVGMTRAEKYLYLTYGKDYGGTRENKPSPFLNETGIKTSQVTLEEEVKSKQESLFGVNSLFREPKARKITNFAPDYLSYSQIDIYDNCPLQYKYKYILNLPSLPSHALSFGNSIHNTLKEFHEKLLFNEVSLEELWQIFEKNWEPLGYEDEEHRLERFKSGKNLLKNYYESLDKSIKPVALEKSFKLKLGTVTLGGRIDRIDNVEGGVEIIDYKTGSEKTQKEVDKDKQVTVYALAVKEGMGLNPVKLSLYFVEGSGKISTTRTQKDMDAIKEEVEKVVELMREGKFDPKPGFHCRWCDYRSICAFAEKE
ncbi:MAG TPA: UvrD-helicase domain-containing protein [bacterium]|nr:UvrD-helicase domain-containing protein [bacterium]